MPSCFFPNPLPILFTDKTVEQITRPGIEQKELYALMTAINRVFDALRLKRVANLEKEFHEKASKLTSSVSKGKENDVALRFLGSYAEECLSRIPDDEPLVQLVLRKAMNVVACVKSISALVASHGTAFAEYVTLFNK